MQKGKVILAGAGPGDPELITVKAAQYLRAADVVITDRLVARELLDAYTGSHTRVIFAGKEGGVATSTPQATINDLLLEHYAPDKLLVRLKGGDVAFFSNVMDELLTLQSHGIPFEIVPGITAASGASASAGIPLTARGYANSVRFLTYYREEHRSDDYWRELAHTGDTLVLYMSSNVLSSFATQLIGQGSTPHRPVAVIEQATTPHQQVHLFSLEEAAGLERGFTSPSLVVIGDVVGLHEQLSWKQALPAEGHFFEPLRRRQLAAAGPFKHMRNAG